MNICSCKNCGVVLDMDVLEFPSDIYTEDGDYDMNKTTWIDSDYQAVTPCPACGTSITKEGMC